VARLLLAYSVNSLANSVVPN